MRDVEAVETLSSQLFVNLLNIVMNLVITLSITAVKNRLILVFFILVAPVAAGAVVAFRAKIHRENRSFRQGMEETSARVMEMVEMVPVARLMPWRIRKRPGSAPSLKKQPTGATGWIWCRPTLGP